MGSPMHSTTKSTPLPFVAQNGNLTAHRHQVLANVPSNGQPDALHHKVHSFSVRRLHYLLHTVSLRVVDAVGGAQQFGAIQPRLSQIHCEDTSALRHISGCTEHSGKAEGTRSNPRHRGIAVFGKAPATKSDLVRCRQHIRRHHVSVLLVASQRNVLRQRVRSVVRVGNPAELSLHPIYQRPKLPPAVSAVSVLRFLARCAMTTRRDTANQDAVAHRVLLYRRASLHHNADALVAQNDTRLCLRDIAAQNVQVRAANGRLVHFDDHISVELQRRLCHSLPPGWFASALEHVCHHRVVLHLVHCGVYGV